MFHRFFCTALLCGSFAAVPLHALAQAAKPVAPIAPPPKPLSIRAPIAPIAPPPPLIISQGAEKAIELRSLRLSSDISGGMAQTTVEMVFFNPNNRNLEGNLQFPLLDGQQIASFALDIEGKLRAAVPVEKAKGQQIFEEIERRNVDPGLLEATQGNNFKLRIFPIPAKGVRTVRIQYTEALARQGKNWAFRLPLAYGDRWQDFELDLALHDLTATPQVSGSLRELAFAKSGKQFSAHVRKAGFAMKGEVNLLIPASLEAQVYTRQKGDDTWFVAEIPVGTPGSGTPPGATRTPRAMPKQIGLLWDSSGSGSKRALEAEFYELDQYFKAVRNGEVQLTLLRNQREDGGSFKIVNGNWDALRQTLQKTVYDGASNLSDWQPQAQIQEYLLVSDGLHNYGNTPFPALAPNQRLYALNSATEADSARLAGWAEASGGKLAQVNPQKPGEAAASLTSEGVHLDRINASGASDVLAEAHEAQNGLLRVAGKLTAPEAQLVLTLSKNGKSQTLKIRIDGKAASHPFAGNLWAAYKLRQLQADFELHRAEIRRIGQQFGLPTRETSLLVLDRLDDYVRYDVAPPPELAAAVDNLKQVAGNVKLQQRQKHMESVVTLFNQKIEWWNRDFPKTDPVKIAPAEKKGGLQVEVAGMQANDAQRVVAETAAQSERSAPRPLAMMAAPAPAAAPMPVQSISIARNKLAAGSADGNNGAAAPEREMAISLKKWTSNAPYIARFKAASSEQLYAFYLDEKPGYANSSAFYLDAADMLIEKGKAELGVRVLSNLAEMDLENRALLRILGYRLLQAGAAHQAIPVFAKVARLAPEEPQSFRDLGLAYAADKQFQKAVDQLNEVVERVWDGRFPEIETIVLAEMNAIIATSGASLDLSHIDPRLRKNLPLDLRVIMTWDADNSDMDLWVTDPNGERCFYSHPLTYQGGRMSRDFTQGYGPEEFSLKIAKPGKYKIETNFYGNRQQVLAGATTLQVRLTTGFGTERQKDQYLTLRLSEARETVFVGEFEVKP